MLTWGLFTASLLLALVICRLIVCWWQPALWLRLAVFALVHVICITRIPGIDVSLAGYVWSVFSELSMATFLLISMSLARLLFARNIEECQVVAFSWAVLLLSLVYYPLFLAFDVVDVYSWGINSPVLIAAIALVAFVLSFTRCTLISLWGGLSLLAWTVGLGGSVNIWDYVIDPLAWVWCGYILCTSWWRGAKRAWLYQIRTRRTG